MEALQLFWDLSILLGLAALLGLIANKFKQPIILGYILAGVILQQLGLLDIHAAEGFELFSKIGIVFLLFILGLELNLKELKSLGVISLVTGLGQIVFTFSVGFILSALFGYSVGVSVIMAVALTFSSTIVIVKLLSRKGDLDSLYGKIAVGFLLVQDLAAIIILLLLEAGASAGSSSLPAYELATLLVKAGIGIFVLYLINEFVLPPLIELTGHDREVLFISVIAIALVISAIVSSPIVGLSVEVGALAAGIALSNRKEALQIESWTKSLRDFFIPVFFVLLGFQIELAAISEVLLPALAFSVFVLIGNPLIVMLLLHALGFNSKVGFKAGLTVAQISEFSLIVADAALSQGQISSVDITTLTIVGGITMTISSYMIMYSDKVYSFLHPVLSKLDRHPKFSSSTKYAKHHVRHHIIVFGFNRMARSLHDVIRRGERKFLVVDNDMDRLKMAEELGAEVIYGDLSNLELLSKLELSKADLIISTVPKLTANEGLLYYMQEYNISVPVIVNAFHDDDAIKLYEAGADFVLHPYLLVGDVLHKIVVKQHPLVYLHREAHQDEQFLRDRGDLVSG